MTVKLSDLATATLSGYSGVSGRGISGYSGLGSSGFSGYSGAAGVASASGWSGYSGTAGSTGTSGFSGWSGYSGKSGNDTYVSTSISANTLTLDLSTGLFFSTTLDSNINTLTITNLLAPSEVNAAVLMFIGDGTSRTVNWPGSFRWPGGIPPTITSTLNKRDVYIFFTIDGGTNWQAFTAGQNL